jgi:hypothetical protein
MGTVLSVLFSLLLGPAAWAASGPASTSRYMTIDQFGYRPIDAKVAVIADPRTGYNASENFTAGSTYEVRRWDDHIAVFSDSPVQWNGGATDPECGDRGWWFDFSSVTTPGTYYLWDVDRSVGSFGFEIREEIYRDVLIAACRMFFYNRSNFAKQAPYADARWVDGASHVGPDQDTEARAVWDKTNPATAKDLTGAWFDAGDLNKYVTNLRTVIHSLCTAYRRNPELWQGLSLNIPESSNEAPDIVDEMVWGLDWVKRMQDADGGVQIKLGVIDYNEVSPPSADARPRYYAPKATSASIVTAGIFADAAYTFAEIPSLSSYSDDLVARAELTWSYYMSRLGSRDTNADTQEVKSGDADMSLDDQDAEAVVAAVYLYAATGKAVYNDYVRDHYTVTWPYKDSRWGMWQNHQGEALMFYTALPGAHQALVDDILAKRATEAGWGGIFAFNESDNLYRAWNPDLVWGSNSAACDMGESVWELVEHGIDPANHAKYRERCLSIVHHIHGVNPQSMVYLSNMYEYGAELSANKIYHAWFSPGTQWDDARTGSGPAPGYLSGGPNEYFTDDLLVAGSPQLIRDQPPQKAYSDENSGYGIWAITEPGIYYQAAYIQLLSNFVTTTLRDPDNPAGTSAGFNVDYYVLSSPSALPDFSTLAPSSSDVVADINYPSTNGTFATSGMSDNMGAVFAGYVDVPSNGVYTFYTESDDGSALHIGSTKVVDNDVAHGMQENSGTIGLKAGKHALRVEYFEAAGDAGLIARYEGPGATKQVIPASVLYCVPSGPSTTYTLGASAGPNGSVSPTGGTYPEGMVVTLTATPDSGYRAASWSGTNNDVSTANTNSVTMNSNRTVTVTFEPVGGSDTDGDGLSDSDEVNVYKTNPNAADTDGDGMLDRDEVTYGYYPLLDDQDGSGVLDGLDDWDADGTNNQTELANGTYPGAAPGTGTGGGLSCAGGVLTWPAGLVFLAALALMGLRRREATHWSI